MYVEVLDQTSSKWWKGRIKGSRSVGEFPSHNVQIISKIQKKPSKLHISVSHEVSVDQRRKKSLGFARAKYTFKGQPKELSFKKGTMIKLLQVDGEWWQGQLSNGSSGRFPANYVVRVVQKQPETSSCAIDDNVIPKKSNEVNNDILDLFSGSSDLSIDAADKSVNESMSPPETTTSPTFDEFDALYDKPMKEVKVPPQPPPSDLKPQAPTEFADNKETSRVDQTAKCSNQSNVDTEMQVKLDLKKNARSIERSTLSTFDTDAEAFAPDDVKPAKSADDHADLYPVEDNTMLLSSGNEPQSLANQEYTIPSSSSNGLVSSGNGVAPLPSDDDNAPAPPDDEVPPIPPDEVMPSVPPADEAPPIPPDDEAPPTPPDDEASPIPPDDEAPPVPPEDSVPSIPTADEAPPLPNDDNEQSSGAGDVNNTLSPKYIATDLDKVSKMQAYWQWSETYDTEDGNHDFKGIGDEAKTSPLWETHGALLLALCPSHSLFSQPRAPLNPKGISLLKSSIDFYAMITDRMDCGPSSPQSILEAVRKTHVCLTHCDNLLREIPWGQDRDEALQHYLGVLVNMIRSLDVGNILLIPSGVCKSESVQIFVLKRDRQSHFSLALCNGDPRAVQQYHAKKTDAGGTLFAHSLILENIPELVLSDSTFWFMVTRPAAYTNLSKDKKMTDAMVQLYEVLLPYLNSQPLRQTVAAQPSHPVFFQSIIRPVIEGVQVPPRFPPEVAVASTLQACVRMCLLWHGASYEQIQYIELCTRLATVTKMQTSLDG